MKKLIQWFKALNSLVKNQSGINASLSRGIDANNRAIDAAEKYIKDRTETHMDVNVHGACQFVTIGRYKGNDYVEIFHVSPNSFTELVDHLRRTSRRTKCGRVDAQPDMARMIKHTMTEMDW